MDIESLVLKELRLLGKRDGRPLGLLASRMLAEAMAGKNLHGKTTVKFHWVSRPMRSRVDLADKDALFAILDEK